MIVGSTIWITRSASRIGAAMAGLAARGAWVAITAPDQEDMDAVPRASAPGQVAPFAGDVRDQAGMLELAGQLGPIDICVLNAGNWQQFDVTRWDSAPIRRHIDTYLLGTVNVLDTLVSSMLAWGRGRIVGVASVAGYRGYTGAEAYGTTKAAEISLLELLRIDLAPHGIVVQTVPVRLYSRASSLVRRWTRWRERTA
jgi:NADP-dependent 3-hydroxy acid dehydrogenase YdfG